MRAFVSWIAGQPVTLLAAIVALMALFYVAWLWVLLAGRD